MTDDQKREIIVLAETIISGYAKTAQERLQQCDVEKLAYTDQHHGRIERSEWKRQRELCSQLEIGCNGYLPKLQQLAALVCEHLPTLWPQLKLIALVPAAWHKERDFDWPAAIAELRIIEAAAIQARTAGVPGTDRTWVLHAVGRAVHRYRIALMGLVTHLGQLIDDARECSDDDAISDQCNTFRDRIEPCCKDLQIAAENGVCKIVSDATGLNYKPTFAKVLMTAKELRELRWPTQWDRIAELRTILDSEHRNLTAIWPMATTESASANELTATVTAEVLPALVDDDDLTPPMTQGEIAAALDCDRRKVTEMIGKKNIVRISRQRFRVNTRTCPAWIKRKLESAM